jgi:hypothetical protein
MFIANIKTKSKVKIQKKPLLNGATKSNDNSVTQELKAATHQ